MPERARPERAGRVGLIGMGTHQGALTARAIAAEWPAIVAADDVDTVAALAGMDVTIVDSLADLASACDVVVFREIHEDEQIERLIAQLAAAMPANGVVVNTRPWGVPSTLQRWAELGSEAGVAVLDAMSSGPKADDAPVSPGWASLMVGGDRDAFERCLPVLESVATTVAHVGGPGSGELAKLVNTMVFNANIMVVAELLELGEQLGFDAAGLIDLIRASTGGSFALDTVASGGLVQWSGLQRNLDMFRTRVDAASAEIRERGLPPSPLEDWARRGIDALPGAVERIARIADPAVGPEPG